MSDKSGQCAILHYASLKSNRIDRSSMEAEILAFAAAFDNAYIIRHDLERMLGCDVPIRRLTDNQALFDVLSRARYTRERRLMVDLNAVREAYLDKNIFNVALIGSEFNVADNLTKITCNKAMSKLLKTNRLQHPIEQYFIERN